MGRALVMLTCLGGCAQLAGIDDTTGGSAPANVSFAVQRVSVGATLVNAPQDLTASKATFLRTDDADPMGLVATPATLSGIDMWTAAIAAPVAVLFDLPDYPAPVQRIFDFPNRDVKALFGVMEHPSPTPAPPGATLAINLGLDTAYNGTDTFSLYTVGAWNQRALEAPLIGSVTLTPPTFAYGTMQSITGRPHERLTAQDRAVVLRYTANQLVAAYAVPPFDQTGTDSITGGTLAAVTAAPLDITVDKPGLATRLAACRPAVGNVTMQWNVRAAVGGRLNNDNGPLLNAATVQMADPATITAPFGNPFAAIGWTTTFTWLVQATRVYTPPSVNLPVTLYAQLHQRVEPSAGLMLALPAGLPTSITIDGKPLTSDGQTIAKPAKAVDVAFATDLPTNTLYQLLLYELVPNMANTALEYRQVLGASGHASTFRLPPELFKANSLYTLRAQAIQGGFPSLADGDLTSRSLPITVSLLDSGVFQVMP